MSELKLDEEILDILKDHGTTIENVSGYENGYEATVEIVNQCFEYIMFVQFDGTTDDFLKNLINDCYNFDPESYAEELTENEFESDIVENAELLDPDESFGIDCDCLLEAEDIEEVLQDLAGDLYAYTYKREKG